MIGLREASAINGDGGAEKSEGRAEAKDGIGNLKGEVWEAMPARMSSMLGSPCLDSSESVDTVNTGLSGVNDGVNVVSLRTGVDGEGTASPRDRDGEATMDKTTSKRDFMIAWEEVWVLREWKIRKDLHGNLIGDGFAASDEVVGKEEEDKLSKTDGRM